ncbi:hypothetical protein [Streptomyces sp. NPDC029674]|uniref:hypothetical protein n=1 Tax=Streptomyces sp. NPDC029674 TaxID=3365297 RepID=UPI00384B4BBA
MRRTEGLCGAAAGLGVAAALVVLGAPPAVAGGPTSVLLVSPESTESAALYHSDGEYADLERWLAPRSSREKPDEEPPGPGVGIGSRQINVTWMAHDVSPWRVDQVYAPLPGEKEGAKKDPVVWVHRSTGAESLNGDWHRAKEPERLVSLFKELGLLGKASDRGSPGIAPGRETFPEPSASGKSGDEQQAAAGGGPGSGSSGTDWWWSIPGAGAGAVAALLLRRPVTERWAAVAAWRRRPHEPGPRQELQDL